VHSKSRTPDEVEAFARAWDGPCGLVLVPTAYPQLDEARIRALGTVRMVIYGNHAIRAAVTAMKSVFARIAAEGGIAGVDRDIVTVEEVFRLQRMDAVKETERRFLR
jgi:phosphoenolpyruvate phosphomutase/phosphonopyruvate hydrolase